MQKLIYPQEIEVWFVLPAIRKGLTLRLVKRGLSQKEIAQIMNSTEASISQYIKKKRASEKLFDKMFDREVEKSAERIIKKKDSLNAEVMKLSRIVKTAGLVCKVHRDKSMLKQKELPCDSCSYHFGDKNDKK